MTDSPVVWARLTAFVPDRPAQVHWVRDEETLHIGRGAEAQLRLQHRSVSRQHAELRRSPDGWRLIDCNSKNGSFLGGNAIDDVLLPEFAWLRFGEVHCEFSQLEASVAVHAAERDRQRAALSTSIGTALEQSMSQSDVLPDTLLAMINLAECDRGLILLREVGGWRVGARRHIDLAELPRQVFAASAAAIERACRERRAVVVYDPLSRPAESELAEVAALLALPILHHDEVLAVVYLDRRRRGAPITEFDLQLLQAFCERAALWLAARRELSALDRWRPGIDWQSLRPALAGAD